MLHMAFTIFDEKAEAYLPPFFFKTLGEALRVFTDSANDQNHMFCKHPSDFTLFALGTFDDGTGMFELASTPRAMGKAINFKTQREMPFEDPLGLADTKGSV